MKSDSHETKELRTSRSLPPRHWAHTYNLLSPGTIPFLHSSRLSGSDPIWWMAQFSSELSEVKQEQESRTLTTSVLVILARKSVRLSPESELSPSSSWRPQMAAPTLPVAIIDGGYMAKLKSARTDLGISPSLDQKSYKTSEAINIKTTPKNKKRGSRRKGKVPLFLVWLSSLVTLLITSSQRRCNRSTN